MKFAFDKKTVRRKDDNGFLHVAVSPISKETINPYLGSEIPGWKELGLNPDKSYNCYRPGEELKKAASTFNGLPILMGHLPESAEEPNKDERIGSMGTDAEYKKPYLNNSLTFTDQGAIDAIESGEIKELSSSYRWTPVIENGKFEGEGFNIRMTNIKGNHLGLVEEGRAGSDVLVHDEKFKGEQLSGKKKKSVLGKLINRLTGLLASDSMEEMQDKETVIINTLEEGIEEFKELHEDEGSEDEEKEKVMGKKEEMKKAFDEMSEDEQKECMDGFAEMMKAKKEEKDGAEDEDPNAEDMSEEDKAKKKAEDMEEEEKAKDQKADDAKNIKAEMRSEMQDLNKAGREVFPVVGDLNALSFDSADEVYREALKLQSVNLKTIPKGQAKTAFRMKRDSEGETILANDSSKNTKELKGCFAALNNQRRY